MGQKGSKRRPLNEVITGVQGKVGTVLTKGRYHRPPRSITQDYKVDKKDILGAGVTGSVYRAIGADGKEYAVKRLRLNKGSDLEHELFRNELEIHMSLDHPHIAKLIDVYEEGDPTSGSWSLLLVMECLTGGSLIDRVVERRRFSERDAAAATWQVLLAIRYLHGKNIAHRDLKMDNMLYPSPDSDSLKLIDFGYSTTWRQGDKPMEVAVGASAYMAPEMLEEEYTTQCDLWSLGVVVYILLFGRMPFTTADAIVHCTYKIAPKDKKHLSADALDFLSKLLVVEANARMTAVQAIEHPWVRELSTLSTEVDTSVVDALCNFQKLSRLRRMCALLLAASCTQEQHSKLHEEFLRLDEDCDGVVTLQEFKQAMSKREAEREGEDEDESGDVQSTGLSFAFQAVDLNGSETITYSEFLSAMMYVRLKPTEADLMKAFQRFDIEGKGVISREDISKLLGIDSANTEAIDEVLSEMASSGLGITYSQWCAFIRKGHEEMSAGPSFTGSKQTAGVGLWGNIPSISADPLLTVDEFLAGADPSVST